MKRRIGAFQSRAGFAANVNSSLNAAVAKLIQARCTSYLNPPITKVESVTKKGTIVSYEAIVKKGSKVHEVAVGPNGEKLAHED
jgi:hypothetical protein